MQQLEDWAGIVATQIAKAVGERVTATDGSQEKLDVSRRFGADKCVNYTSNSEWWQEVLELTNGNGVDVVYDPVGLVDKSLKCLKQQGRILVIGFAGSEGNLEKIAMNRVLLKQAQIIGYVSLALSLPYRSASNFRQRFGMTDRQNPAETAEIWKELRLLWDAGQLRPTVYDNQYKGLEDVVMALKHLQERKVWGKAVVLLKSPTGPRL